MCNIFNWISPSLSRARQSAFAALHRVVPHRLPFGCFFPRRGNRSKLRPSLFLRALLWPRSSLAFVADRTCNYFLVPCGLSHCKISSQPRRRPPCALRTAMVVWVSVLARVRTRPHASTRVCSEDSFAFYPPPSPPLPRIISWFRESRSLQLALGPVEKTIEELVTVADGRFFCPEDRAYCGQKILKQNTAERRDRVSACR